MENQILRCDDPQCDEINCRVFWKIVNSKPHSWEDYINSIANKYCDAEDIDYKVIVEALIFKNAVITN